MKLVRVGTVVNTFGIKGELKVKIITDFADERFAPGQQLFMRINGQPQAFIIAECRFHKNHALIQFEGLADINLVEGYKGVDLFSDRDEAKPLKEGYYAGDLLGFLVYENAQLIGEVIAVEPYPAHSVLRVKTADKTVLIPFVPAFIASVDPAVGRINVQLIEGIL